jgi:hypothetical protein
MTEGSAASDIASPATAIIVNMSPFALFFAVDRNDRGAVQDTEGE